MAVFFATKAAQKNQIKILSFEIYRDSEGARKKSVDDSLLQQIRVSGAGVNETMRHFKFWRQDKIWEIILNTNTIF